MASCSQRVAGLPIRVAVGDWPPSPVSKPICWKVLVDCVFSAMYCETSLIRHSMGPENNVGLGGCWIMKCLLPYYISMVSVPHIVVGLERMLDYRGVRLERMLDYRGVGLEKFHCIPNPNPMYRGHT